MKAIKEAVEQLRETNPYRKRAEVQVAILEKAMRTIIAGKNGGGWETPGIHEAFDVIEKILREAPCPSR